MRKFLKNCKGAVTVMVTLLLIPAILISGTGVDLARIYVARSTLQDANQLALNSTLASYDALLQDLYGLFGVMKNDPELADMVDKYIKLTVLTDDGEDGMGTFQLFYGSNVEPGDLEAVPGQNLNNPEVLRRQIEEYAKFRAPVIIINELLDRLGSFKQTQADAEVIQDKLDIEDGIEDLNNLYKKIYQYIQNVNRAKTEEEYALKAINDQLDLISAELKDALFAREKYTEYYDEGNEELQDAYEKRFNQHLDNIKSLINGGNVYQGWYLDEDSEGHWSSHYYDAGLRKVIDDAKRDLEKYIEPASVFGADDSLYDLLDLCQKADSKKAELSVKVDALERKINSGNCSDALKNGMPELIESYRKLLSYDLEPMARAMINKDEPQIRSVMELLDEVDFFGASLNYLTNPSDDSFQINFTIVLRTLTYAENVPDKLGELAGLKKEWYHYSLDSMDPFYLFQSDVFSSTHNPEFYAALESMLSKPANGDDPDEKKSEMGNALKTIQDRFKHFWEFDPEGAKYYAGSGLTGGTTDMGTDFGSTGDWSDADTVRKQTKDALGGDLISMLGNAADAAVDKLLLLTYDSEMFSCYATNKRSGEAAEVSMSGIPLGTRVNYYYQSELEYLYNGNVKDAIANLKTITSMIFLVRFVFNYVASFSISEVQTYVEIICDGLAWAGPVAIVVSELARLVFALGESVCDVSRLKNGCKVALYKDDETWTFSISGMASAFADAEGPDDDTSGILLTYKDYVRVFLLLVDGDTLALRTANLIALNMTNYRDNINAKEDAMTKAQLFDMSQAATDFRLTTTVDLRMLFLSMPFAQKEIKGILPPKTLAISATDYRGF